MLSCKNKNYFSLIPIDLSTVFDIVAHQVLLKKILFYGISNKFFNWLSSYLSTEKKNFRAGKIRRMLASCVYCHLKQHQEEPDNVCLKYWLISVYVNLEATSLLDSLLLTFFLEFSPTFQNRCFLGSCFSDSCFCKRHRLLQKWELFKPSLHLLFFLAFFLSRKLIHGISNMLKFCNECLRVLL